MNLETEIKARGVPPRMIPALLLVAKGKSNPEIEIELKMTAPAVKRYILDGLRNMNFKSRYAFVLWASQKLEGQAS